MCEVTTFYDLALENFSLKEKDIIEKILDLWSKQSNNGYRIKLNLFLEHFLAPELISKILQNIIINSDYLGEDNNTKLLEDGYQEICRQNLLQGGEISGERPIIVGTVINKSKFIGELKKQDKDGTIFLNDPQEIENFVEALLKPDSNFFQIFITQERRSLKLKRYNTWVTWDTRSDNPFSFRQTESPNEIRLCLSLAADTRFVEDDLLLFTYKNDFPIFRPTIADAQVGSYFQPPPETFNNHGLTCPCYLELQTFFPSYLTKYSSYSCERRPEGLHEPIAIDHVITSGSFEELSYGSEK